MIRLLFSLRRACVTPAYSFTMTVLTALGFVFIYLPVYAQSASHDSRASHNDHSGSGLGSNLGSNHGSISGFVRERGNGEALSGITLTATRQNTAGASVVRSVQTNKFGRYVFSGLPVGTYQIIVWGVGFTKTSFNVALGQDSAAALSIGIFVGLSVTLSIALERRTVALREITVESEALAQPPSISAVTLTAETVKQLPAIGGEHDIFRALQLMPGVKTSSELSSGLNVRGGSSDQNLVLLDGASVYNPYHLGGFLSIFNTDAVSDIRFFKGAFPAEYGGRLSSVLDLTMREGAKDRVKGSGYVSLVDAKALVEGPIGEQATFLVSGRRMYLDALMNLFDRDGSAPRYNFYDVNAKINYTFSDRDRLFVSAYGSADHLFPPQQVAGKLLNDEYDMNWSNLTANLRWLHVVSPELLTQWSLIATGYAFGFNAGLTGSLSPNSAGLQTSTAIQDITLRGEAYWLPNQDHTVKVGVDATRRSLRSVIDNQAVSALDIKTITPTQTMEAAVYAQDEVAVSPTLSATLGARLTYFGGTNSLYAEPRLSLMYKPSEALSLYASYGVMRQFSHLVSQLTTIAPNDVWFPASEALQPEASSQYIAGASLPLWENNLLLSVETYYKTMSNIYEFRDDAQFLVGTPAATQLTKGTGTGYGVEILLQKKSGNLSGWAGYTLSWAERLFPELNGGKAFAPRYDKRHDITVALTYHLNDTWEFGASWTYQSGQPITLPTAAYSLAVLPSSYTGSSPYYPASLNGVFPLYDYTERNAWRLPAYHRLDVSATHHYSWFGLPFHVSLNVYNAYNRANAHFWWLEGIFSRSVIRQISLFPILPTVGIGFTF